MPLKSGYSRATVEANVRTLINEGKSRNQAYAIALEHARESFFKRHPGGALPLNLAYPGGRRMKNPEKKLTQDDIQSMYNRAYIVYWSAFDADNEQKMRQAKKLMREIAKKATWQIWPPIPSSQKRGKNPVPPSKKVQIRDASELYENFTGHKAKILANIKKPDIPDVLVGVGEVDGILYTTVRDGVTEKYIHEFHKDAKPAFCVAPDGSQIFFIGGEYDFTERGIIDRTDPKQQE